MKYRSTLLFFFVFSTFFIPQLIQSIQPVGFGFGTQVKTPDGYKPIEKIAVGEKVISFNIKQQKEVVSTVVYAVVQISYTNVHITTENQQIVTAFEQLLYDHTAHQWIPVEHFLKNGNLSTLSGTVNILEYKELPKLQLLCDLVVEPYHNFYITSDDILVHNFAETVAGFSAVLVPTLEASVSVPTIAPLVLGTVAVWQFGKWIKSCLSKKEKRKRLEKLAREKERELKEGSSSNGHGPRLPDDDPKDSYFEKLKDRADRVVRTERFGKMYRDPDTKLWWSNDRGSNHAGPHCKVFKQVSDGYLWIYNATINGMEIIGQHKGPIGKFIPMKDVIGIR